ncbi:MAG TPA: FtsX-like permease family protein [Ilumatobacteraceae bacterium]|nr:FtsX-like permease family protein [Ilumatobacteraceae bacterium]
MFKLALKGIVARKGRVLLTSLAVILGTAFLAGTFIFSDTLKKSFNDLFADVFEDTDAYVRSTVVIEGDFGSEDRQRIPDTLTAVVAELPHVRTAEGSVFGFARVIGKDGKPVGSDGNGPPTFGSSIAAEDEAFWTITAGRLPNGAGEVALDAGAAKEADYEIGDTVKVVAQAGSRQFTLVGIAKYGDVDSPGGATFALFDLPTAQEFVGRPGFIDAVVVKSDGTLSDAAFADEIQAALPADSQTETLTGAEITKENQDSIEEGLSFFTIFLTVFSFIALGVACFVIYNVFSITAAQRQRENALLRAVGAQRAQITRAMLIESVVVGIVGSLLGLVAGIGVSSALKSFLGAIGVDFPSTTLQLLPRTIVLTIVVGVIVTVLSAIMPALRGGRVSPLAAMRDSAIEHVGSSRTRLIVGLVFAAVGGVGIGAALAGASVFLLGAGVLLVAVGVLILGPVLALIAAKWIGKPVAATFKVTGRMAQGNASRNPKRTSRAAAPVLIGVALVTAVALLAATLKAQVREIFGEQFVGDYVVKTDDFTGFGGLSPDLADKLNDVPQVAAAAGIGVKLARVDDKGATVTLVDPSTVGEVFDLHITSGSYADLKTTSMLVSDSRAKKAHLKIGDVLDVNLSALGDVPLTIVGTYSSDELAGDYVVNRALYANTSGSYFDFSVFINLAPGVSAAEAVAAIQPLVDQYGTGDLQSRDQYIDDQASQINTLLALIYGLLALSIIIAAVGIVITLLLSVYERRHEIALLRAVGMTRAQVRSTVRWESVITSLLGAVLGVILGLFAGYLLVLSLRDEGVTVFSVPIVSTIVILVVAFIVGVIAAIIPARRATKVDIIEAIATT